LFTCSFPATWNITTCEKYNPRHIAYTKEVKSHPQVVDPKNHGLLRLFFFNCKVLPKQEKILQYFSHQIERDIEKVEAKLERS
jgi:hypothetical protein